MSEIPALRSHHPQAARSVQQAESRLPDLKTMQQAWKHQKLKRFIISLECRSSELPVFVNRLDRPVKFLPERLREEPLNGYPELLGEDYGEARIDVVLQVLVSTE